MLRLRLLLLLLQLGLIGLQPACTAETHPQVPHCTRG